MVIRHYISLTKPGIIRGNLVTAAAGFLLASRGSIDLWLLVSTLSGIGLLIGGACVYNNYVDRRIDAAMARTRQRVLVSGQVSAATALAYATGLTTAALVLLAVFTNYLTVGLGVTALFAYVVLYGLAKRRTPHGTLIGTLPGALPPVAGYTAVSGRLDAAAAILLMTMVCWQMAHFYAIAIYRLKDYMAAGLPVWPVRYGIAATRRWIAFYIGTFTVCAVLLMVANFAGYVYLMTMLASGVAWFWSARPGLSSSAVSRTKWASRQFGWSLAVLSVWCILLALSPWLP